MTSYSRWLKKTVLSIRYRFSEWNVVECPMCGALMRLGDYWVGNPPECPKCNPYDWEDSPKVWSV